MLEAVRVDADDPAGAVEHRRAGRARRRTARCARGRRGSGGRADRGTPASVAVTWPHAGAPAVAAGGHGDDDVARRRRRRRPTSSGRDVAGVDVEHDEVAVDVAAGDRRPARRARRRSATSVVSSRRLWALVSTLPGATTKPVPRPWRPMRHDGGRRPPSLAVRTSSASSSIAVMALLRRRSHYRIASDSTLGRMARQRTDALDAAARRIGDRWSLRVVGALLDGDRTFGELAARRRRHRPDDPHRPAAVAAGACRWSPRPPTSAGRCACATRSPSPAAASARPSPRSPSGAPTGRATATGPVHARLRHARRDPPVVPDVRRARRRRDGDDLDLVLEPARPQGGVRAPGGLRRLQSGWDGRSPSGGFDSRPPPLVSSPCSGGWSRGGHDRTPTADSHRDPGPAPHRPTPRPAVALRDRDRRRAAGDEHDEPRAPPASPRRPTRALPPAPPCAARTPQRGILNITVGARPAGSNRFTVALV